MKQTRTTIPLLVLTMAVLSPVAAKDASIQLGDGADGSVRDGKPVSRGWTKLFDGKTLAGWMGEKGYWEIKDGAIVGTQPPHAPLHHYLFSTKDYSDFELHIDVKLVGYNSGVCIRIAPETYDSVPGYQVDMGDGYWGCLWEEHKRETKVFSYPKEEADKILHKDDWNHYFARAIGHHITIYLNGVKTVDGDDPQGLLSGPLGFQLCHSGPEVASFKNIYIKTLQPPTKGTAPLPPTDPANASPAVPPTSAAPTAPTAAARTAAPPPVAHFDHKTFWFENSALNHAIAFRSGEASTRTPSLPWILDPACGYSSQLAANGDPWTTYRSRDGGFIARFPGVLSPPKTRKIPVTTGARDMKIIASSTPIGDAYLVSYMSLGTMIDRDARTRVLNGGVQGLASGGKLLSNRATTFRGYMAREIVVRKYVGGQHAIFSDMTFIVRDRLYQIMTVLREQPDGAALTRRFQAGFNLLTSG